MEHDGDSDIIYNWCIYNNSQGLVKVLEDLKLRGQVETIQTTALLRSAWILRRALETLGDLLSLKFQWRTISERWCENSQKKKKKKKKNIIIIIILPEN